MSYPLIKRPTNLVIGNLPISGCLKTEMLNTYEEKKTYTILYPIYGNINGTYTVSSVIPMTLYYDEYFKKYCITSSYMYPIINLNSSSSALINPFYNNEQGICTFTSDNSMKPFFDENGFLCYGVENTLYIEDQLIVNNFLQTDYDGNLNNRYVYRSNFQYFENIPLDNTFSLSCINASGIPNVSLIMQYKGYVKTDNYLDVDHYLNQEDNLVGEYQTVDGNSTKIQIGQPILGTSSDLSFGLFNCTNINQSTYPNNKTNLANYEIAYIGKSMNSDLYMYQILKINNYDYCDDHNLSRGMTFITSASNYDIPIEDLQNTWKTNSFNFQGSSVFTNNTSEEIISTQIIGFSKIHPFITMYSENIVETIGGTNTTFQRNISPCFKKDLINTFSNSKIYNLQWIAPTIQG